MRNYLKSGLNIKLKVSVLILLLFASAPSFAQYKLNFGLSQPQDKSTLPKSKSSPAVSVRKSKINTATILKPDLNNEFILSSGWEMSEAEKSGATGETISDGNYNSKSWYNAVVPGTVLTTLVQQGVYADPYYGLNNLAIPDTLCRMDWWYRNSFKLPKDQAGKKAWIILNGINYRAVVWLNGKKIGKMNGAFIRGEFDVTDLINKTGTNILAVHILPPPNPGIPHEESPSAGTGPNGGQLCLDGPTFISSEGWDWVPGIRDRNIGIWQDVRLRFTGDIILSDPQVITDLPLPDTTMADLKIKTQVKNNSTSTQTVTLTGSIETISFSATVELNSGETKEINFVPDNYPQLKIKNPKLWWPNGYGNQNLYVLKMSVALNKKISDQKEIRFGIRELSYELTVDTPKENGKRIEFNPTKEMTSGKPVFNHNKTRVYKDNISISSLHSNYDENNLTGIMDTVMSPYLVIKVNGQRIFCKGGNWGMDDAMKRVDRDHLEPYFKLHKDANFTMIRNWTGESTEALFYELADEYGLLVWNDFWLSTGGYNLNVNDNLLFLDNVKNVVKRFRNHPSIAIWCARNEGVPLPQLEEQLEVLLAAEDPTRFYNPDSRALNLRWSGPWHYLKNQSEYFTSIAGGFSTELGTPSVPTAETMRKMMSKEDVWPISDVWYYHDLHDGQKDYIETIEKLYGKSETLDDFCKKAQMVNYDSHRTMFESWNSHLWNTASGVLLWMTHPAWPSTVWQVYSSDYETFGSYFGSKKACESIHIQMNPDNSKTNIINTTLNKIDKVTASLQIYDLDGNKIYQIESETEIKANSMTECKLPFSLKTLPEIYLIRLKLEDRNGKSLSVNEYWKNNAVSGDFKKFNSLQEATISASLVKSENGNSIFEISNSGKISALAVKLNLTQKTTGENILPAYFSDEYFTLLPGEKKIIRVEYKSNSKTALSASAYNLPKKELVDIQ